MNTATHTHTHIQFIAFHIWSNRTANWILFVLINGNCVTMFTSGEEHLPNLIGSVWQFAGYFKMYACEQWLQCVGLCLSDMLVGRSVDRMANGICFHQTLTCLSLSSFGNSLMEFGDDMLLCQYHIWWLRVRGHSKHYKQHWWLFHPLFFPSFVRSFIHSPLATMYDPTNFSIWNIKMHPKQWTHSLVLSCP